MKYLYTKEFWAAAAHRAARTFAQTLVSSISVAAVMEEIKWPYALSASAFAALVSILMAIATGLPEAEEE